MTQEKKSAAREGPDWQREGVRLRLGHRLLYSALVHKGLTLLQAACILSNRCSQPLPAEQRTK